MSVTRQVIVDDTDSSIIYHQTWGHDQGISGVASASDEKILGPAFNGTATFAEADLSLSFTFTGTSVSLNGGINFVPTGTFGRCFIDGVATDNSTELMIDSGIVGTNDNPLCTDPSLPDGTHVLTFNISGLGTYTPALGANGAANRVWVDEIVYNPSSSVSLNTVPALMIFAGDSAIQYSSGWTTDGDDSAQVTSQNSASVTFDFQGTSIDYYGTLMNNIPQSASSTATYSIDGQTPIPFSIVDFHTGSTANNVPMFRSGTLSPGKHTLTVVNQGNSSVIPLALQYLIVVPTTDSTSVKTSAAPGTTAATSPATSNTSLSLATTPTATVTSTLTSTSGDNTAVTSAPAATSDTALDGSKKHLSASVIGGVVAAVVVVLLLVALFFLLCLRRRRRKLEMVFPRTSILQKELEYPDISAIPRPEIPTPLPLPLGQQGSNLSHNEKATQRSRPSETTSSSPLQQEAYRSRRERKRRPPAQDTPTESAPQEPSNTLASKASQARNPRALSDLIINHDDSGLRLPQPDEEVFRRVVEFPPTYAP